MSSEAETPSNQKIFVDCGVQIQTAAGYAASENNASSPLPSLTGSALLPRVLRSPSHESVATDLSLLSLSSYGSDMRMLRPNNRGNRDSTASEGETVARGSSPHALRASRNSLLQVPGEQYGSRGGRQMPEILFEEESDVIRSCAALSSALGLRRSFSSSEIVQANSAAAADAGDLRPWTSEVQLNASVELGPARLDYASRSCSTWVAVGDMASNSQLPSPQGLPAGGDSPAITAAAFVRSVNKTVRQCYIKKRLLTLHKALERVAQSELALDQGGGDPKVSKTQLSRQLLQMLRKDDGLQGLQKTSARLTAGDVERERGKPMSKYERNMMIFTWLNSLEENSYDRLA